MGPGTIHMIRIYSTCMGQWGDNADMHVMKH